MDERFKFGGQIGFGDSSLVSVFLTPKYSDCMQYYTMLLEQFDHILAKDLVTAT